MKLCTVHRKRKEKGKGRKSIGRHRGTWPPMTQPSTHGERDRLYSYVETVRWQVSELMANMLWDRNTEDELAEFNKTLYSWWSREIANPISKIDDCVKHVLRQHSQEADLLANMGTERQRKFIVDRCIITETWKAVKGFWDGSAKDNGKSGCGVVIKGFDRNTWVMISRKAVPWNLVLLWQPK